jgi:plastocyanin
MKGLTVWVPVAGALAVLGACGGSSNSGGGGSQTCTPGPTAAIVITASGLTPVNVCVSPGGTVTFTNSDTAASHDIEFETGGASCPTVGQLAPGAHVAVVFPTAATCTFHDGNSPSNAAFRGTVAVTQVTVSGGGY